MSSGSETDSRAPVEVVWKIPVPVANTLSLSPCAWCEWWLLPLAAVANRANATSIAQMVRAVGRLAKMARNLDGGKRKVVAAVLANSQAALRLRAPGGPLR